jgi:hypothetical protein
MARILEERTDVTEDQETQETLEEETTLEQEQETTEEQEVPQKYQGKSTAEIIRMHQEAEKLLGKQSSEVGELRKVVDDYIQTQLSEQAPQQSEPEEDIDFFSDPDRAVARAIDNHPKIREAEQISTQYRQSTASLLIGLRVLRLDNSFSYRQTNSMITKPLMNFLLCGKNDSR